jgi:hypothetical protein
MTGMSNNRQNFSDDELRRTQAETGVDVYALLDLLERTPAERLRIAMANARNVSRLRDASDPHEADELTATPGAFDPLAMLGALHKREVRFVVIGGVAGFLLGSSLPSANLDFCFARDPENVGQLARALNDVHARPAGFSGTESVNEDILQRGDFFNFRTDHGVVHCLSNPAGTSGYEDLQDHAERMQIDGVETFVASLADLIRMKEVSHRVRDGFLLETLRVVQRLKRRT